MLAISDLTVRYGMHEALSGVSLQVATDEIVVILGANGAGKSSLLSAVAGNSAGQVDGRISLNGDHLTGFDAAEIVARGIAFVPEGRGVFADLTVEENLQLGSYTEHARRAEHNNMRNVLSLFPKLSERKKQIVRTMSGGEQQMVAIGRALMSAPSILMLDEPSLGLSPLLCKELFSSLQQVRDSGVGILLVEQNAKQSLSISDRGYLLGNGKIIGQDSAKNLLNDPTVQAAYLGGAVASKISNPIPTTIIVAEDDQSLDSVPARKSSHTGLTITPNTTQYSERQSSDSLLSEDINSLVARASSSASNFRKDNSTSSFSSLGSSGSSASARSLENVHLPETQDAKVQALLAEFETAAKNVIAGSKAGHAKGNSHEAAAMPRVGSIDDGLPLPHIPVYKNSSVTVYRRDSTGKLNKQDKP